MDTTSGGFYEGNVFNTIGGNRDGATTEKRHLVVSAVVGVGNDGDRIAGREGGSVELNADDRHGGSVHWG